MNKLVLTSILAFTCTAAFAQKDEHRKPKTLAAPPQVTPIKILYTDSTATENKKENSWKFTNARLLLHGTDTLTCDVMICKPEAWKFMNNVRVTSPDGLVMHANEMTIDAKPKK